MSLSQKKSVTVRNSCLLVLLLALISFSGCEDYSQPDISIDEFVIKDGFKIEVVASEPLLDSPVAMIFDAQGRIWAVELTGYMRNIDGDDEDLPDGRIVILEDRNGDGRMDKRTVFIDSLRTPRAISFAYGGLLYAETPNLWWVPIEGDRPGKKELVDSVYVVGGNIEHQPNGLLYNLDNWIYSAKCSARYRRKAGKWIKEATTFRGQWGISQDDEGRLYYNSNSNPLKGDFTFPNQLIANPFHKAVNGVNQSLTRNRRLFPIHDAPVNRGYNPGALDSLGRVKYLTSGCSPVIYRGDQFPDEFKGNAFICAPEGNIVKRYLLSEEHGQIKAESAYSESEFLASKDGTFRPVNLYNGFDGSLYVLDLRKGIIQHRAYMSSYLRDKSIERGLDTINGLGRIYRIYSDQAENIKRPVLNDLSTEGLLELLQHPNGQLRSFAQQQLVFEDHQNAREALEGIAMNPVFPLAQIHALWVLEGLNTLRPALLEQTAQVSETPLVMVHLLKLSEFFPPDQATLWPIFEKSFNLASPKVDLQLCHTLGRWTTEEAQKQWDGLAKKYGDSPLFSEALISGIAGKEKTKLTQLAEKVEENELVGMLQATLRNKELISVQSPQFHTQEYDDSRTRGSKLYATYCATCHGQDGKGIEDIAPPLYHSEYVMESPERLILIALHGMQGPVTVNGQRYEMNAVMPGIKNNPELSDEDIATILRFIGNGFNPKQARVSAEKVKAIREMTADREALFTAEELDAWIEKNLDKKGD